ncbi:MAG: trypsin-like peptidase domain-containing protein [Bryobacteraceae bacterium]|nr:trypsin-like peptidase domain-containing protein [Bryobacteraceae bacterium]
MKCNAALFILVTGALLRAGEAPPKSPSYIRGLNDALVGVAEKVTPAVVKVATEGYRPAIDNVAAPFGLRQASGSGVILSPDGYIITNAHVVGGMTRIQVQLTGSGDKEGHSIVRPPGRLLPARLVGIDNETDLALLKVDGRELPHLTLADSETVRQGQLVVAIGSPIGLESSVSMGVVSAVARQLQHDDRVIFLQTDAPINPGSSGGALVDLDGKLLGINTLIMSQSGGSQGLGFAVPSNIVRFVVDQLRQSGFVLRGELGVEAQTLTEGMAGALGLNVQSGVILADVFPGGPGFIAGLKAGDIILSLNGKRMENARQFHVNLYQQRLNSIVRMKVARGGEILDVPAVVLERSTSPERFANRVNDRQHLVPRLSILALPIDEEMAAFFPMPLRRPYGILVVRLAVTTAGPGGELLPGDVIYEVNRLPVSTVQDLRNLVDKQKEGDPLVLQVERAGRLRYVEMQLE